VFLSFPVVRDRGEVRVASKDVDLVLNPILRPAKNKPGQRVRTVALCAGHGGKDPGNHVHDGREQEKYYTLVLAREVSSRLNKVGIKVVMIRDSDQFIELEDRPLMAKRAKADLYVSLHYNTATNDDPTPQGSEVYCLTPTGTESTNGSPVRNQVESGNRNDSRNVLLAYLVQKRLVQQMGMTDRAVRRASFVVLKDATMPAVLIEAGFMSNPNELKRIKDPTYRGRVAQAIVDGVLAYKRETER
jgi:N-acetylmuramoyl-L-alanine amidase